MYYDTPKQVMFTEQDRWLTGIAYKDEIFCACCGIVFKIDDIIKDSFAEKAIYPYNDWVNLEEPIQGGELPIGLTFSESGEIIEEYEQLLSTDEEEEWIEGLSKIFCDEIKEHF